ncbi:MAG: flagellar protein FlgN [Desulfobulbus propionicus]|nr:MAG: flagellar protein FlgN [Desulfobulbus propionicus]
MTRENVRDLMEQLLETILSERTHAKELDMKAMLDDMARKEDLIMSLKPVVKLQDPEDQKLARRIQQENRRNAFLFRSTLNWIQETMEFFGRKASPCIYGNTGTAQNTQINGRLLSGKI